MASGFDNWIAQSLGNLNGNEPLRKNAYEIVVYSAPRTRSNDGDLRSHYFWNAKTVTIPNISFEAGGSQVEGNSFLGDGFVMSDKRLIKFGNVKMTLYNLKDSTSVSNPIHYATGLEPNSPVSTAGVLLSLLNREFSTPPSDDTAFRAQSGIETYSPYGYPIKRIDIKTKNPSDDTTVETFRLEYARITNLNFGDLSYSSDDLQEVEVSFEFLAMRYFQGDEAFEDPYLKGFADNVEKRMQYIKDNLVDTPLLEELDIQRAGVGTGFVTAPLNSSVITIANAEGKNLYNSDQIGRFDFQRIVSAADGAPFYK